MMTDEPKCLYCGENSQNVPLVNITYQGKPLWICNQHLPMLIHKPEELADHLERASREQ